MAGYFRDDAATDACMTRRSGSTPATWAICSDGYLYIVGRAKDMIIVNGRNHWPQDIEWAVEQLPGFKAGRHRRLRDHHAGRRGNARGAGPVPHLATRASASGCATKSASASAR